MPPVWVQQQQINVTKFNSVQTYKITHKHAAIYAVALVVEDLWGKQIKYTSNEDLAKRYPLSLEFKYKIDNKYIFIKHIKCNLAFGYGYDSNNAFLKGIFCSLFNYEVPTEIPADKEIDVEVIVRQGGDKFYETFGNPSIHTWITH